MNEVRRTRLVTDHRRLGELAAASDRLEVKPIQGDPPERYLFLLDLVTTVKPEGQEVRREQGCIVEVFLPISYPFTSGPAALLRHPANPWHPNVEGGDSGAGWGICTGAFIATHFLDSYVYQLHNILVFRNYTTIESNCLNSAAAEWARHSREWFPTDPRPLCPAPGVSAAGGC